VSTLVRKLRTAAHAALSVMPSAIKVPVYRRVFGFKIARGAKIGVSMLDVDHLEMAEDSRIGHGNLLSRTQKVTLARGAEIGFLNVLRGGDEIAMGDYSTVMRFNVINAIPDNDCTTETVPKLTLGPGAYVTSGHRLDFTDRITLGTNVIVAGRNSSLWTHNRQVTKPITIDDFCYLGSEVRLGPGAQMGANAILGMGAVLVGKAEGGHVHAGVPARPLRELDPEEQQRLRKKSRRDIPEDLF
jgi:acetyltransferase-like isoleucine patch superfamily enzyme